MNREPLSEAEIHDELKEACERMSWPQRRLWEAIKIEPQKWRQEPFGNLGGGFWVVAIIGNTVIWYNDIEHGFNRSKYIKFGEIAEYWCNQDNVEWQIQTVLDEIRDGAISAGLPALVEAMA